MALASTADHAVEMNTDSAPVDAEGRRADLRAARLIALREVVPVLLATLPLALAVGMTVAQSSINAFIGWLAAPLVFAGSSHLALVSTLGTGASAFVAVGAALVVNARFAVYGAALGPLFERQPRWFRLIGPHVLVDQTFALIAARPERHDPDWMRAYYLSAATALATMWLSGVAVGIWLEPVLPHDWPIGVAGPLMVGALLGTSLRSPRAIAVASTAFLAAVVTTPFIGATGIIVAGAVGVVAGRVPAPSFVSGSRGRS